MSLYWMGNGHFVAYAECLTLSRRVFHTSSIYWENIVPQLSTYFRLGRLEEFGCKCSKHLFLQANKYAYIIFEDIQTSRPHTTFWRSEMLLNWGRIIQQRTYFSIYLLLLIIHIVTQAIPYSYGYIWKNCNKKFGTDCF